MKKLSLLLMIVALIIAASIWWPKTVGGQVVHGETGEPLGGVDVNARVQVLKPWWLLEALAWGDVSTSVHRSGQTDAEGRFRFRVFAGLRLDSAHFTLTRPGFIVRPRIDGRGGSGAYSSNEDDSRMMFELRKKPISAALKAWPASEQLARGYADQTVSLNGTPSTLRTGPGALNLLFKRSGEALQISARWNNGVIMPAAALSTSLVAPFDGYLDEVTTRTPCEEVMFFVRGHDGSYGWLMFDTWRLCDGDERLRVKYRISREPGIRALACPSEVLHPTQESRQCTGSR